MTAGPSPREHGQALPSGAWGWQEVGSGREERQGGPRAGSQALPGADGVTLAASRHVCPHRTHPLWGGGWPRRPDQHPPVRARGRGAPTSPPVRLPVALSATGNCLPWAHPSPSTLRSYFGVPPVSPAAGGMGTGPATVCALLPARLAELALNLVECGVFTTSLFRNTNALGSHTIVPV